MKSLVPISTAQLTCAIICHNDLVWKRMVNLRSWIVLADEQLVHVVIRKLANAGRCRLGIAVLLHLDLNLSYIGQIR